MLSRRNPTFAVMFVVLALAPVSLAQQGLPTPGAPPNPAAEVSSVSRVPSLPASLNSYEGLRIANIRLDGIEEDPKVTAYLRELLGQTEGEQLKRRELRKGIQALYATGRFSDIELHASRGTNGEVALIYRFTDNRFIGAVTMTGAPRRPTANQLINATKLNLGELYTPQKIEAAARSVRNVLADGGYYRAVLTRKEIFNKESRVMDIHFYVSPGEPARVGEIRLQGAAGFDVEKFKDISGLRPGDEVSGDAINKAVTRVRTHYQKQDRLEAQIAIAARQYHPDTNTVDYTFALERGPTIDIHVEGMKLRQGILKRYVPVFEENAVDDDLLNEGRRNLRDYLQTKGYFDVQVEFKREREPGQDHEHVIYVIDRGERHKVIDVSVEGNRYFPDETIRERMTIRPAGGWLTRGRFSQTLLSRDVEAIENLYKANGFRDVKVTTEVQDDVDGERGDMRIAVRVQEGAQSRVNAVEIAGNTTFSDEMLAELLNTSEGQPFSDASMATDRDSLTNFYFNRGFPDVQVEATAQQAGDDPTRINTQFTIKEGRQVFVDEVQIGGLVYTRPNVVKREFEVHNKEPLSQSEMLDTQRNLYDLGIFNEVEMAVANPSGNARYKDLLFQLREAKRWTFNYGLGFEFQLGGAPRDITEINTAPGPGVDVPENSIPFTDRPISSLTDNPPTVSPRFSFEVTRLNFRGRDHTVSFKTNLSRLQQRGVLSYEAPRWFDKPNWLLTFTALYDNSRDVRTFAAERIEGSVQASQSLSRVTTLLYRFQYRRVSVDPNSLAISPALIPLLSRPVRVGMPGFTYIRDRRDNPLDARRGTYTTFDFGLAAKVFGSQADFSRFLVQNSSYHPIRRNWVIARMTRIGVAEPFGKFGTLNGDTVVSGTDAIPLPERFFGGGSNSHRGFALNQAGPRDTTTGFPLGGNATFLNSVEVRTPAVEFPFVGENLSFVLFHDMGNVFESGQEMLKGLFRLKQRNVSACLNQNTPQCDFAYNSMAVGVGARYQTPIGPVRLDLSYNLSPPKFPFSVQCAPIPTDDKGEPKRINGPCGNSGPGPHLPAGTRLFRTGTLRGINVFFSIGQSF